MALKLDLSPAPKPFTEPQPQASSNDNIKTQKHFLTSSLDLISRFLVDMTSTMGKMDANTAHAKEELLLTECGH